MSEAFEIAERLKRRTRDPDVLRLCDLVMAGSSGGTKVTDVTVAQKSGGTKVAHVTKQRPAHKEGLAPMTSAQRTKRHRAKRRFEEAVDQ